VQIRPGVVSRAVAARLIASDAGHRAVNEFSEHHLLIGFLQVCGGGAHIRRCSIFTVSRTGSWSPTPQLERAKPPPVAALAAFIIAATQNFGRCLGFLTHQPVSRPFKYPPTPSNLHSSFLLSIAIMCASCNGNDSNGHTNGNGTAANGANGHEGFTSIKSAYNPHPSHKSSPYAPVGDFLSNISRFKIIGTSLSR